MYCLCYCYYLTYHFRNSIMKKIAIIGAGLSGISAAHLLKDHAEIEIFEKSRGVSGRMSTRRTDKYSFDHGAQYFTARTEAFKHFIQPLIKNGVIERWNARYVKFKHNNIIERKNWCDEEPRYVGSPSMNQVVKFLAKDLDINVHTKIEHLKYQDKWHLTDENGNQYSGFDWVICTNPPKQALNLLPKHFKYYDDISQVDMEPCFSLMLGFETELQIPFDAAHITDSDLSWIAVNSRKPKRLDMFTLVINSSEKYAKYNIDGDQQQSLRHLIKEASGIVGCDLNSADYKTIHAWRYANNVKKDRLSHANKIFLDQENNLAVCGDWCHGGRVEGAFMSAYHLVDKIKEVCL